VWTTLSKVDDVERFVAFLFAYLLFSEIAVLKRLHCYVLRSYTSILLYFYTSNIKKNIFWFYFLFVHVCVCLGNVLFSYLFFSLLTHRFRDYYFVCAIGGQNDGHLPYLLPGFVKLIMLKLYVLFALLK